MVTKYRTSIAQDVRDYVIITIGLLMYAIGFTCFQLPYEITTVALQVRAPSFSMLQVSLCSTLFSRSISFC